MKPNFSLHELAEHLGGELVGEGRVRISRIASLENAQDGDLSFLVDLKHRQLLQHTRASALIVGPQARDLSDLPRIVADNPYAYFARVLTLLNPAADHQPGVDASAVVDASTTVPASVNISPNAVIGRNVCLGENVSVGPGCFIGDGVSLGDGCLLHANVTIYHGCQIGKHCVLHAGAVIGSDGFGFAEDNGKWIKIPQVGKVVIGDHVEIGANTTIDRGTLDDTIIEEGAKLDNLIQVAHNCRIGAYTVIAGCTGIAGSVRIGRYCRIGGAAMISGHLAITDGVTVSGGTLISKSVHEKGVYTAVMPLMTYRSWLKNASHIRHLEKLAEKVKCLEAELNELKGRSK